MPYLNIVKTSKSREPSSPVTQVTNLPTGGTKTETANYESNLTAIPNAYPFLRDLDSFTDTVSPYDHSESFTKIKQSGRIKMTPYSRVKVERKSLMAEIERHSYFQWMARFWACNTGYDKGFFDIHQVPVKYRNNWTEQGDLSYWTKSYSALPFLKATLDVNQSKIERAKGEAWGELLNGYGLGEEVGEISETIALARNVLHLVHHPLSALTQLRKSLKGKKNAANVFMNAWMQYRYAIMPLVYSAKDITEIVQSHGAKYQTARRRINGNVGSPDLPSSGSYFHQVVTYGSIETKVTAKARWGNPTLRTMDRIGVNLFSTAWELIPLSFVLDWFVNFGDIVTAYAETLTSLSSEKNGCVSTRQNYHVDTYLHLEWDETTTNHETEIKACEFNSTYPTTDFVNGEKRSADLHIGSETVDRYDRVLFNHNDIKLTFDPFLNWKRLIDGSIISLRVAMRLLSKLRK